MIWTKLAWAFLVRRWGQAVPAVVAGALGILAVTMVMIAERELPLAAEKAFGGVDVVIGPKGSALDLVLCCVLHATEPKGLVPLDAAMAMAHQPGVAAAAPLALGDNYKGVRIVGTTPDVLTVYHAKLAQGAMWTHPSQAVVGAEAARSLGMHVGSDFVGSHGLAAGGEVHAEFPYLVTGVLAPTGSALDRVILTSIDTIYAIHRHHAQEEAEAQGQAAPPEMPAAASAVVASVKSPVMLAWLPRKIDADGRFSAAVPTFETARLLHAARPLGTVLEGVGLLFGILAAASATAAVAGLLQARSRDLALLRVLGAHPLELAVVALAEAVILGALSLAIGLGAVWALGPPLAHWLALEEGLVIDVLPNRGDLLFLIGGVVAASVVAAAYPAWRSARVSVEKGLLS